MTAPSRILVVTLALIGTGAVLFWRLVPDRDAESAQIDGVHLSEGSVAPPTIVTPGVELSGENTGWYPERDRGDSTPLDESSASEPLEDHTLPTEVDEIPTEPVARRLWFQENRERYYQADGKFILRVEEEFSEALANGYLEKAYGDASALLNASISVILGKQGREELVELGSAISFQAESADQRKLFRNNWTYLVNRSEFPEYFDLADAMPGSPANPDGPWPEFSSQMLQALHRYSQEAMDLISR